MLQLPVPKTMNERKALEALSADEAAWLCDADVSGGSLKPLSATDLKALWSGTALVGEVPEADLAGPAKPASAPTLASVDHVCKPTTVSPAGATIPWLKIYHKLWRNYVNASGEMVEEDYLSTDSSGADGEVIITGITYTPTGFKLQTEVARTLVPVVSGALTTILSRYQFAVVADSTDNPNGGPKAAYSFPVNAGQSSVASGVVNAGKPGDPVIPEFSIPLYDDKGRHYATLSCTGVDNYLDETFTPSVSENRYYYVSSPVFTFDCNYAPGAEQAVTLCSANVDADGREGPPSDISSLFTILPGERPTFGLAAAATGCTRRLYVNGRGAKQWLLLADEDLDETGWSGDQWTDDGRDPEPIALPDYGDYSVTGFEFAAAMKPWTALLGDYAVALVEKDGACKVYSSDRARLHAWPEEWAKPVTGGARKGIASLGNRAALLFTENEVHLVSGDPANLTVERLSSDHPLLNPLSLCRVGGTVFWVTTAGLAACSGGAVRLVSEPFVSREQWKARTPAAFTAQTDTVSVFLTHTTPAYNRRFVLGDGGIESMAAFTAYSAATPQWQTGVIDMGKPVMVGAYRVIASGDVTTSIEWDGNTPVTPTLSPNSTGAIAQLATALGPGRRWQFRFSGAEIKAGPQLHERRVIDVPEGGVTITHEMVDGNWGDIYLKFPDKGWFVAAMVNGQQSAGVKLAFSDREGSNGWDATITPGRGARLAASANVERELYRLAVTNADGTPLSQPLEGITLYTRRTVNVSGILKRTWGGTGVAPWWIEDYQFDEWVVSAKVLHGKGSAVALTGEMEGSAVDLTTDTDGTLTSAVERLFDVPLKAGRLSFHFGGDDDSVREIQIRGRKMFSAGERISGLDSYRGIPIHFPDRGAFACYSVGAHSYTGVSMALIKDGAAHYSASVADGKAVLLPRDKQSEGSVFLADVKEPGTVFELILKARERVPLQGKSLTLTANDTGMPPWWAARYELAGEQELTSVVVKADSYPVTMSVWKDGSLSTSTDITVSGPSEIAVTGFGTASAIDFDFGGSDDYKVNEVGLFFRDVKEMGDGGVTLPGPFPLRRRFVRFANQGKPSAAIIKARGYSSASLALYRDGAQIDFGEDEGAQALTVTSGRPIILPRTMAEGETWEADFANGDATDSLSLLCRKVAAVKGTIHEIVPANGLYPWLLKEYDPEERADYVSALILGVSGTLTAYKDGAAGVEADFEDGVEVALADLLDCGRIAFDLGGDDLDAKEIFLFAREDLKIKDSVVLRRSQGVYNYLARRFTFDRPKCFRSARVIAEGTVTLAFSADGEALCEDVTVTDGGHVTLPRMDNARTVDVSASGAKVEELGLSTGTRV